LELGNSETAQRRQRRAMRPACELEARQARAYATLRADTVLSLTGTYRPQVSDRRSVQKYDDLLPNPVRQRARDLHPDSVQFAAGLAYDDRLRRGSTNQIEHCDLVVCPDVFVSVIPSWPRALDAPMRDHFRAVDQILDAKRRDQGGVGREADQ